MRRAVSLIKASVSLEENLVQHSRITISLRQNQRLQPEVAVELGTAIHTVPVLKEMKDARKSHRTAEAGTI